MKKINLKQVEQYSIEGILLKTFKDASEASIEFSNYDSIISCCKGKYKTSGGYIWKFQGENIEPIQNNKQIDHYCKICNSGETIRSMAMHLKFVHNLKTDEYVKQYEEYRPKNLKSIETKNNSIFKCNICNEKLNSNQHLMYHLTKIHPKVTKHDYIVEHMLNGNKPLCKCGCGGEVTIIEGGKNNDLNKYTYFRDYIKDHWDWEVFSTIGKQSKEEIELVEYIKTIYKNEIQTSVRGLIPKNEIDIYLPNLNIAIEYNGLYWHSEKGGRFEDYHMNKMKQCNNKGIRLIQIFSDEWINKKEIVKSKLNSIIGNNLINKIYARKCTIKDISPQIKNEFLDKYHIQGKDKSKIKYGLYHKDELVAVMTFSNPRMVLGGKNKPDFYELSRYATKYNIVGGASKLLKHFIKNNTPKYIYSYSDNRWSDLNNNMYFKIGFTKESISKPNYSYTKNFLERIHRFNFSKQNLKLKGIDIKNKTEKDIMNELGYCRVWDCGVTRFGLNINSILF
jgi:hypothetical protein